MDLLILEAAEQMKLDFRQRSTASVALAKVDSGLERSTIIFTDLLKGVTGTNLLELAKEVITKKVDWPSPCYYYLFRELCRSVSQDSLRRELSDIWPELARYAMVGSDPVKEDR